jgi:hypothetical protein
VGQELLVERAPVGPDAHGLAVADRGLHDRAELPVLLVLEADIAGIDAVLVERFRAGRVFGEELVADIVEVADERDVEADAVEPLADSRDRGRGFRPVHRDAHDFRACPGEGGHLRDRGVDVGRVGVRHRLHDDRRAAADGHGSDRHRNGAVARPRAGRGLGDAFGISRPFEKGHGTVPLGAVEELASPSAAA